jgi:hypothetical protein
MALVDSELLLMADSLALNTVETCAGVFVNHEAAYTKVRPTARQSCHEGHCDLPIH